MKRQLSVWLALLLLIAARGARADVALPGLFSDNMVLQQGIVVPIWGTAADGEKVTVRFQGQEVSAIAREGRWTIRLQPLKPGGPAPLTVVGNNTLERKNVLVGEVWVCSGQSNMAFQVSRSADAEAEIANSTNPSIRLLTVRRAEADAPAREVSASWQECNPGTVGSFSAAGYFFGRELQKTLNVPIGLINSSVGGTPAEAWTPEAALRGDPELAALFDGYDRAMRRFPTAQARNRQAIAQAKAEGKPAPRAVRRPLRPSALYNAMIAPLQPYAIRGAIWYQGEANAGRAYQYRKLFPLMIRSWREAWGQGDFPFLFVQLAAFGTPDLPDQTWPELREAQLLTLSAVPQTGMTVTTDVGDEGIHPPKKQPVGARLALAAQAIAYGKNLVYSGPIYEAMSVEGSRVALRFKHVGGGLTAQGGELKGFSIAGEDRKFVPAVAEIQGDRVVVSSPDIAKPVAVRYAWARYPVCNLFNKEGLPASPFRTDAWPGVTQPKP